MRRPRWEPITATRVGARHRSAGRPGQDAVAEAVRGEVVAVAVADGHGDDAYHRSDVGAALAARTAVDLLVARASSGTDAESLSDRLASVVGPELVQCWTDSVLRHGREHPWWEADEVPADDAVRRCYGTTLVALVATPGVVGLLQVGDGEAVVVAADGSAVRPLPSDPRLVGNLTTSLGQQQPLTALRTAAVSVDGGDVRLAWAVTDGFSAPQVDQQGWWRDVSAQLSERLRDHGPDWVREQLAGWLAEPARVGGDDTSLALLVRA